MSTESFLCARHCSKGFTTIISFTPQYPGGSCVLILQTMKHRKVSVTCLKSHSE